MKPKNITLRRRLAYVESQLETEALPSRHSLRLTEERQCRLVEEKISIQRSLDSIVYPILTLPVEVTAEIFVHCLPERSFHPSGKVAPLLLSGICRQWRDIACSTPKLWAVLGLNFSRGLRPNFQLLLLEWLRRARTARLSLRLARAHGRSDPSLTSLPLTNNHWAHPNSFHGAFFTPAQCFELLSLTPRLTRCDFVGMASDPFPSESPLAARLIMKSLHHLRISPLGYLILDWVASPVLRSLEIAGDIWAPGASILQTFDAVFYDPLARLGNLREGLNAMPLLTSLRLALNSLTSVFGLLRMLNESTAFLSSIQKIELCVPYYLSWTDSDFETLTNVLTSIRWEAKPGVARLVDFKLRIPSFHTPLDDRITACVSELRGNLKGMNISVNVASEYGTLPFFTMHFTLFFGCQDCEDFSIEPKNE
ncbi:hypothetical protein B0H16DRAFT_1463876 [Mycena metata]|uniref:F-box domain-containing protein n=1 Tax=Mycena metata TaxID=1033252 RepID=A0AAD7IIP8_9AGAR|nr:hypothetical protein B0H16DRAFT_1463876 [Mycena metata]